MYAKIFQQIFSSSIAEYYELRHIFMDLIVLADSDGVVDMTHESIARQTNIPLEKIKAAILALEGPDPRSRSKHENGARIKRLDDHRDWGWVIINYDRFRDYARDEQRREKTKLRTREYRNRLRNEECDATVTHSDVHVTPPPSGSGSGSGSEEGESMRGETLIKAFHFIVGELYTMFRRGTPPLQLPYHLQEGLMALAGRPTMKQELAELKVFRAKQSYFPQSIDSLVENWDKTLDRARNYTEPSKDGKPKDKPIIMKDLERMAREAGL